MNIAPSNVRFGAELKIDTSNFPNAFGADAPLIAQTINESLAKSRVTGQIKRIPKEFFNIEVANGNDLFIGQGNKDAVGEIISKNTHGLEGQITKETLERLNSSENFKDLSTPDKIKFLKYFIPTYVNALSKGHTKLNVLPTELKLQQFLNTINKLPTFTQKELAALPEKTRRALPEQLLNAKEAFTKLYFKTQIQLTDIELKNYAARNPQAKD